MPGKTEVFLPKDVSELRYVNLPEKEKIEQAKENIKKRILAKVKSNPFIPIGILTTSAIIGLGFHHFIRRNHAKQQFYMRARVTSQALTFVSFILGTVYYHYKNKNEDKKKIDYSQF